MTKRDIRWAPDLNLTLEEEIELERQSIKRVREQQRAVPELVPDPPDDDQ